MQLPVVNTTDLPARKFHSPSESDIRSVDPPNVIKPLVDMLPAYREFKTEVQPQVDLVRAADVRGYLKQQRDDRIAYRAWLQAHTAFNDHFGELGYDPIFNRNVGVRKIGDRLVKLSGIPCLPLPREEREKEVRADGSVRRKKQKVNKVYVVHLEPGDFWGPHSGDQYPPKTKLNYLENLERSEQTRKACEPKRKHLSVVEDKGPYNGPVWDHTTMGLKKLTQGFEGWPRPPTLLDLWADHWRKLMSCPKMEGVFEATLVTKDGSVVISEKIWKYRDGSALGLTPLDDPEWMDDGSPFNHGAKTENVAANDDLSQYGSPLTPLQEKLEIGTETVSFRSISMMDDLEVKWLGKLKFRERTSSGIKLYPELKLLPPPVSKKVLEHPRFKQSESYWAAVENRRWVYPKGAYTERSRYLAWLEERSVHNHALGRAPMGDRKDFLLACTIPDIVEGAFALAEISWYDSIPDEKRYDLWCELRQDAEAAKLGCVHQSFRLPPPAEEFIGPPCPPTLSPLAHINLVDRLDYERMEKEEPISAKELEEWMDHVATTFQSSLPEEVVNEYAVRNGLLTEEIKHKLLKGHKRDVQSGLYVPANIEIIRKDPEDILNGHIEQFYKNEALDHWQKYCAEKRTEFANRPKSMLDKVIEVFQHIGQKE